ncbi:DUF7373 family lipoprotein [Nocardia salmonicida]|uniref:DUF7373 family lipoprotein n=1 Tax=Nocardia salmonicida TaxID=53431 RepID=UPI0037BB633F
MLKLRYQRPRIITARTRGVTATAAAISLLFISACGNESTSPNPPPAEPTVELSKLQLGNYSAIPQVLDKPIDEAQGRAVQAQNLANHIPLPMEIDSRLKHYSGVQPKVFTTIDHKTMGTWVGSDLEPHRNALAGFISGFTSAASSDAQLSISISLENRVLIFDSEESAAIAMNTIVDSELSADPKKSTISIPQYPTARAYWKPDSPTMWSWYTSGKFVIFTSIWDRLSSELSQTDLPGMMDLVTKTLAIVPDRISGFTPASKLERDSSSPDWDGMLARAVPAINDKVPGLTSPGVYDRYGGLQISRQPELDRTLFETTGVDRVAFNGGYLYRAKDSASATAITNQHATFTKYYRKIDSPPALPVAKCYELKDPTAKSKMRYYCSVNFDRYAADISANQLDDAYQRISAQYALLANGK